MDIINVINTVGFPIACVVAMALYCKYLTDNYPNYYWNRHYYCIMGNNCKRCDNL